MLEELKQQVYAANMELPRRGLVTYTWGNVSGIDRKAGLVVLEDDKGFFPEYNGAFLIREDTLTRFAQSAPNLEETLNLLAGKISNEDMVDMTYQVDVQGRSADEVAAEFLHSHGLLA